METSLRIKYRNRKTDRESTKIYDVIDGEVSLNDKYKVRRFYVNDHNTLFNEIVIVPYKNAVPQDWLVRTVCKKSTLSKTDFINGVLETLKEYIKETWSKTKHHVVFHSSGWDSRIISTIIRQLYVELGDSWLGELKFVCMGSECKNVKSILEIEGWNSELGIILQLDDAYFMHNLNFQMVWKYVNGYAPYPINNSLWGVNELKRRHMIPESPSETQVWAASFFNELISFISNRERNTVNDFLKRYYYCTYAQFASALPYDFVQPILNEDTIRFFLSFKTKFPKNLRHLAVKKLNPKLVDVLPCPSTRPPIPVVHLDRVRGDYKNSWYGTNILQSQKFTDKLMYSGWWSAWSTASFIEYLIKQGIHVLGGRDNL